MTRGDDMLLFRLAVGRRLFRGPCLRVFMVVTGDAADRGVGAEGRHHPGELLGFLRHRMTCRRRLFHHGRILLRHLVELVHGDIDFRDAGRLLFRGDCDRRDQFIDVGHGRDDLVERLAGLTDEVDAAAHLLRTCRDERLDFLRCGGRPLGEGPDFFRHDGKAETGVAGAGRLHPGVEGQKVGLERDVVDDADDLRDLFGGLFDLGHGGDGLAHHFAAFFGVAFGVAHDLVGAVGAFGGGFDARGQLFERGRGFFQGRRLAFGAARQIVGSLRDFAGAGLDAVGGDHHAPHGFAELCDRAVEIEAQLIELFGEGLFDLKGEIAVGKALQGRSERFDNLVLLRAFLRRFLLIEFALAFGLSHFADRRVDVGAHLFELFRESFVDGLAVVAVGKAAQGGAHAFDHGADFFGFLRAFFFVAAALKFDLRHVRRIFDDLVGFAIEVEEGVVGRLNPDFAAVLRHSLELAFDELAVAQPLPMMVILARFGEIGAREHAVMPADDFVPRIAHYRKEGVIGRDDRAVELEFDNRLRAADGADLGAVFVGDDFRLSDVRRELHHFEWLAVAVENGVVGGLNPDLVAGLGHSFIFAGVELAGAELFPERLVGGRRRLLAVDKDGMVPANNFAQRIAGDVEKVFVGVEDFPLKRELDHRLGTVERFQNAVIGADGGDVVPLKDIADIVAVSVCHGADVELEFEVAHRDVRLVGKAGGVGKELPLMLRFLMEHVDAGADNLLRIEIRPDLAECVDIVRQQFLCRFIDEDHPEVAVDHHHGVGRTFEGGAFEARGPGFVLRPFKIGFQRGAELGDRFADVAELVAASEAAAGVRVTEEIAGGDP